MSSTRCEVRSVTVNFDFTIHVDDVQTCVLRGDDCVTNLSPPGLSVKLAFGSTKKDWLSLCFYAPATQTFFFQEMNVAAYSINPTGCRGPQRIELTAKVSKDISLEGLSGRSWDAFIALQRLMTLGKMEIEIRGKFERRSTSVPLEICHDPRLHQDMLEFFRDGFASDAMIVIGDARIPVLKSILMKRSEYFRAMFESGMKESETNEIKIQADEKLFRVLLEFWYCGNYPPNIKSVAWDLIEVAHFFQAQPIVEQCEFAIRGKLEVDRALDALVLADRLGCARLKKGSIDVIAKNLKELRETEKFAELKKNPDLMFEVLYTCGDMKLVSS